MFLTNPFPGAFGLDIADLSIKLARLSYHHPPFGESYFTLHEVRQISLPPGVIVDGEIQQPEIARNKILHLLGKEGPLKPIRSPWVVANLPEPKSFLKLIELDTPEAELMEDDVIYQAKKHLPFELAETYFDWQIIKAEDKTPDNKTRVLVAAAPKTIADSYTYLLEAAGLNPLALEVEAMSVVRTMITRHKDYTGMARVILDLGATRSSLIIFDHDTIQFSTNLNFSGELITKTLAQELRIDYAEAEKLKIANGLRHDRDHPKYLKIVADMVDSLTENIRKSLTFYKEHFGHGNPITHVTMCGGGAQMENMDNIISHSLRIGAHPGNVWKNIAASRLREQEKSKGLSLASALGLALRAAQNPLKE